MNEIEFDKMILEEDMTMPSNRHVMTINQNAILLR